MVDLLWQCVIAVPVRCIPPAGELCGGTGMPQVFLTQHSQAWVV